MTIYAPAIEELAKIVAPCEYSWSEEGKNTARLRALAAMRYFFSGRLEGTWSDSSIRSIENKILEEINSGQIPIEAHQEPKPTGSFDEGDPHEVELPNI